MKKLSQLAHLMDTLDISILELSKQLYVDKTTISKWRTGSRKLSRRSPYFKAIVQLFLEKSECMDQHPILTLWSQTYPGRDPAGDELRTFLEGVLGTEQTETTSLFPHPQAEYPSSWLPEYTNYIGIDGRKKAVDCLLSVAEQMDVPGAIKILELEQMDWLCRDMTFLKTMMSRVEKLAQKGAQTEFAFSTMRDNAPFRTFILLLENMRYLKTVKIYFVNTDRLTGLLPRLYAIADVCVAVGMDSVESSAPVNTNFYSDYLNTHKYALLFDRVVELFGCSADITDSGPKIDKILHTLSCMSVKKQDLFYFSDYLSIVTMGEELFAEILNHNHINGNARERCLNYYRSFRAALIHMPKDYYGSFYLNVQAIEEALDYDSIMEYEMTALTNRPIHKSQEQYRRHLQHTIQFLNQFPQVRIVLRSGGYSRLRSFSWFKRNMWGLSMNTHFSSDEYRLSFLYDAYMIKLTEGICEEAIKSYPVEHSLREVNIHTLVTLLRDAENAEEHGGD